MRDHTFWKSPAQAGPVLDDRNGKGRCERQYNRSDCPGVRRRAARARRRNRLRPFSRNGSDRGQRAPHAGGKFATPRHYRETRQWIFREHDAGIDLTRCDALLARGDLAVALVEERAHRGENVLTYGVVLIFHVVDGAVTELRIIAEDSYALDRFWE